METMSYYLGFSLRFRSQSVEKMLSASLAVMILSAIFQSILMALSSAVLTARWIRITEVLSSLIFTVQLLVQRRQSHTRPPTLYW